MQNLPIDVNRLFITIGKLVTNVDYLAEELNRAKEKIVQLETQLAGNNCKGDKQCTDYTPQ